MAVMSRKPVSQMEPSELEAHREYMRLAKAESRARKREQGLCIVCGVNRPRKPPNQPRLVTCDDCNEKSYQFDLLNGFPRRPSQLVDRRGVKMYQEGYSIKAIAEELELEEWYVVERLKFLGYL
jgi:hypothetical protein